jgi:hypothetical protein
MPRLWSAFICCSALLAGEAAAPLGKYSAAERRHWAFQARKTPELPAFSVAAEQAWAKNPIDAFILARMKKEGLAPAAEADRTTLLRRASLDLTGLPPTPQALAAFLRDRSPNAWEKAIDALLASPAYGEQWGQHWLDVVRFAESDGFEYDTHRPDAWRYRDYVIRSFRDDKPYPQFILEQLAGDEMQSPNEELRIASGFQRLGPLRKNAGNQEVASSRNEVLTEMTNITSAALLGLTLGCARCHDHKFDPLRQSDYYRLQAYFAAVREDDVPLTTQEEQAAWKAKVATIDEKIKTLQKKMSNMEGPQREAMEQQMIVMEQSKPDPLPSLFSVRNDFANASPIHLLHRGEHTMPKEAVKARPPGVLLADNAPEHAISELGTPRRRLAEWIAQPDNPLTARVMVNRVWQFHFGQGIVTTPNDFGRMGTRPSHPELLDWLANTYVQQGWKLKPLHKMILMSSTWKQSSIVSAASIEKDPANRLLSHFTRRRLSAEELRDSMLSVAGAMNSKAGGPGVMIPVDPTLTKLLYKPWQWKVAEDPREHDRRSVYLLAKRNLRLPMMESFDAPDLSLSCARRESSTHAPQALELLNGDFANRMAEAFAARLQREAGKQPGKQVELAWKLATGHAPTAQEKAASLHFLREQPLREFALSVLNLNRFLYVN